MTYTADPVPNPPPTSKLPRALVDLVQARLDLFKIVTPIKHDVFKRLLEGHPNRPFVDSVVRALQNGFWPWAEIPLDYPSILSHETDTIKDDERLRFYIEQCEKEFNLGRFSAPFGDHLMSGMACMPIWIILHNGKYRMITDHSYGPCSLNALIDLNNRSFPLASMQSFGRILRKAKREANGRRIILFKSDVSQAYRRIPMHPLWQPLQATQLPNGKFAINRNNVFGGAASGRCWWSVSSLMLWIAEHVYGIDGLSDYVDDIFGWEYEDNTLFYAPYNKHLPARQARLLMMWDELGIPHEESKQIWGVSLPIIGFQCDTDSMTVSMPEQSRQNFDSAITDFIRAQRPIKTLKECQRLAGHVNWVLNVTPRLQPGLASLYEKMYAPFPHHIKNYTRPIRINQTIKRDLDWLRSHFLKSDGVFLFQAIAWDPTEADLSIYTDASLSGIGMWSPDLRAGYYADIVRSSSLQHIFYYEAFVVICAIHWATQRTPVPHRLVVHTDNMNTVDIFNSMKAHGHFNDLLIFAVDLLIQHNIDL